MKKNILRQYSKDAPVLMLMEISGPFFVAIKRPTMMSHRRTEELKGREEMRWEEAYRSLSLSVGALVRREPGRRQRQGV